MKNKMKTLLGLVIGILIFMTPFFICLAQNQPKEDTTPYKHYINTSPVPVTQTVEQEEEVVEEVEEVEEEDVKVIVDGVAYTTGNINLRQEPSIESDVLQVLKPNTRVDLLMEIDDWTYVELEDETHGYIKSEYLADEQIVKTIYDIFTQEELWLLFRVVQAEVGDEHSFDAKVNVANVIFNRMADEEHGFGNTIKEVLNRSQFQCIKNGMYRKVEVSDATRLACEYAYLYGDTTGGALFYMNRTHSTAKNCQWFDNNLTYLFRDDSGHSFYK